MARRGRRMAALACIGSAVVLAVIAACGPGNLSDLTSGKKSAAVTSASASAWPGPGCKDLVAPPKNAGASNVGGTATDITFAMDNIRLDGNTSNADPTLLPVPLGLDLDQNCTCSPDKQPSCIPFDGGQVTCDTDAGTDNNAAALLTTLTNLISVLKPDFVHKRLTDGIYSMIFDVVEWNGQPEDPHVQVSVRMSTGIDNGLDDQDPPQGIPPRLDGSDVWAIDPESISDGANVGPEQVCGSGQGICLAMAHDDNAYVTGGKVVAKFPTINITLSPSGANRFTIPYIGVTLVAAISQDPTTKVARLNGEMSGRWLADSILAGAGALGAEEDGGLSTAIESVCGPIGYAIFKSTVCSSTDLTAKPADDNTGKTCGAISEAMRFTAISASAGHVRAAPGGALVACGGHEGDTCEGKDAGH